MAVLTVPKLRAASEQGHPITLAAAQRSAPAADGPAAAPTASAPTAESLRVIASVCTQRAEAPAPGGQVRRAVPRHEEIIANLPRSPGDWYVVFDRQGRSTDASAAKAAMTKGEAERAEKYGLTLDQFNAFLQRSLQPYDEADIKAYVANDEDEAVQAKQWRTFLAALSPAQREQLKRGKLTFAEAVAVHTYNDLAPDEGPYVPVYKPLKVDCDPQHSYDAIFNRFERAERESDFYAAKAVMSEGEMEKLNSDGMSLEEFGRHLQTAATRTRTPAEAKEAYGEVTQLVSRMTPDESRRFNAGKMTIAELTYIESRKAGRQPYPGVRPMPQ